MRLIIHAIGSAGDVHPFLGMGMVMKARRHEVIVVTNPYFERAVKEAGLEFYPLGTMEDFERLRSHPDLWHPRRSLKVVFRETVEPTYELILKAVKQLQIPEKTLQIGGSLAFGMRNAYELLNVPYLTVHLSPALFVSCYRQPDLAGAPFGQWAPRWLKAIQWWAAGKTIDYLMMPKLNAFRNRHQLPPVRNLMKEWWHSPDRVIGLFPDWFGPPQPDWPGQVRLTGFPMFDESNATSLIPEVDAFLREGPAPVVVTPGSAMMQSQKFFREAISALKQLGLRGLLLTPFRQNLPDPLPVGMLHASYIPFSLVLPRSAALIYHGGIGTCAQALKAGIPHLIQPMAHDQFDTLSRVRDLGVGDGLVPSRFHSSAIAKRLKKLLDDPEVAERAKELSNVFEPELWLRRTCEEIESMFPR